MAKGGNGGGNGGGNTNSFITISGGAGDDALVGTSADESLKGKDGNDLLIGGGGTDELLGGAGNDTLIAGSGNDILDAGAGDDILDGGAGDDLIDGGSEWDIVYYSNFDVRDYTFLLDKKTWTVTNTDTGTDTLTGVEELHFNNIKILLDGTNNGPLAIEDVATLDENLSQLFDVIANDWDFEGDSLTLLETLSFTSTKDTVEAGAGIGTVSVLNNQVSWDPGADYDYLAVGETATITITYEVVDSAYDINTVNSAISTSTLTLTVTGSNDGPVAVADEINRVSEDARVLVNALSNDTDVDLSDTHTVDTVTLTSGLGLVDIVENRVEWKSDGNYNHLAVGETAVVVVGYTMSDSHGSASSSTVTINIIGGNDGPVAYADTGTTDENSSITVDVLANDTDVDLTDTHTVDSVSITTGDGTASIVNNQIQWVPGTDYDYLAVGETATVVIDYRMSDQYLAASNSTLTLTITGSNDGPVAVADEISRVHENARVLVNALSNDTDVDLSDTHTIDSVEIISGLGAVDIVENRVEWVAGANYNYLAVGEEATVVVDYTMSDNHGSASSSTVTINIIGANDGPTANVDANTTDENASITVDVLANDTDLDLSDTHTVDSVALSTGDGTASIVNNQVQWEPGTDYDYLAVGEVATVVIDYTMSDQYLAESSSTLTLVVTGSNDSPEIQAIDVTTSLVEPADASNSLVVDFEDIDIVGGDTIYLTEHAGFNWSNQFGAMETDEGGFPAIADRGAAILASETNSDNVGFFYSGATISRESTFDFDGLVIASHLAAEGEFNTVTITGYLDGVEQGSLTVQVDRNNPLTIDLNNAVGTTGSFDGINSVVFTTAVYGVPIVVDNLQFSSIVADPVSLDTSGSIAFTDLDLTDRPTATEATKSVTAVEQDGTTALTLTAAQITVFEGAFSISADAANANNGTVNWDYAPTATDINFLGEGEVVTAVFTITVTDDEGTTAEQDVTITITGSNDGPSINVINVSGSIIEGDVAQSVDPALSNDDFFAVNYYSNTQQVLLNDGSGVLVGSEVTLDPTHVRGLDAGDLNGDGFDDLVMGNDGSGASVYFNNGDGTFTQTQKTDFDYDYNGRSDQIYVSNGWDAALEDFDGDGDLDAYIATWSNADSIWLNDGSGVLGSESFVSGSASRSRAVDSGDLDGDGDSDVVVVNSNNPGTNQDLANDVLLNNGDGTFVRLGTFGQDQSYDIDLADVDGDGDLDAFVSNYQQPNTLWLNDGSGNFTDSGQAIGSGTKSEFGDLDGDGDVDLFVTGPTEQNSVWLNDGNGQYSLHQSIGEVNSYGVALADLDGDGDLDAYVVNNSTADDVFLNDGTGSFQEVDQGLVWDGVSVAVISGDFDGSQSGQEPAGAHNVTGSIEFTDLDLTDRPTATEATKSVTAVAQDGSTTLTLTATQIAVFEAAFSISADASNANNGTVNWAYTPDDASLDFLGDSEVVTAVFTVTVTDDESVSAEQDVAIMITGSNDGPSINEINVTGAIVEAVDVTTTDFVVVWTDQYQDNSGSGVFGQRYDENGVKLGDEFLVNTKTYGSQQLPSVATFSDGGFVVTWFTYDQEISGHSIHGQQFGANGEVLGSEFTVSSSPMNFSGDFSAVSSVTALSDDGFVVTWSGQGNSYDIYGQRYSSDGIELDGEFLINTNTSGYQTDPSVTALSEGGFVVTWNGSDSGTTGSGWSNSSNAVVGQVYDELGTKVGTEFRVNTYIQHNQFESSTAALTDGGFVVTWTSAGQDDPTYYGVFGQRYNDSGTKVGTEFQVNSFVFSSQYDSSVTGLADGGFVVSWSSLFQDGSNYGIYGQRYDVNGEELGAEFRVNTGILDSQSDSEISALSDGGFVVTWTSSSQDSDGSTGVYGQRYDENGIKVGIEFQVNSEILGFQQHSSVAGFISTEIPTDISGSITFTDLDLTDRPVAAEAIKSVTALQEDGSTTLTLTAAQIAVFEAAFSISADAANTNSGTINWAYAPDDADIDFLGEGEVVTAVFTVTVTDDEGATAEQDVTITVTGTNDGPIANVDTDTTDENTSITVNVLANDTDLDLSDTHTVDIVNITSGLGSVGIVNNQVEWTPGTDYDYLAVGDEATVEVAYDISDSNGGIASSTLTLTVTGTNDSPVVSAPLTSSANEDDAGFSLGLLTGSSDVDRSDVLSVSGLVVTSGDASGVSLNTDGKNLDIDPAAYSYLASGISEVITYSYNIVDGNGGSVSQTATIAMTGTNDDPTVSAAVSDTRTEEDTVFTLDLLEHAADVNVGDTLSVSNLTLVTGDASGVTDIGNSLSIDPNAYDSLLTGQVETIVYSYDVIDGKGGSVTQTATINITGGTDYTVIVGTEASDRLIPLYDYDNPVDHHIIGLGGNDLIYGYYGNDRLEGGDGNDFLALYDLSETDYLDGGEGDYDRALLADSGTEDIILGADGNGNLAGTIGAEVLNINSIEWLINFQGGSGNDTVDVTGLSGQGGTSLYGSGGDDILTGGDANDGLYGGNDNDTLAGGSGNDILSGQNGADIFLFNFGDTGIDTIQDFNVAERDVINFVDLLSGSDFATVDGEVLDDYLNFSVSDSGLDAVIEVDVDGAIDDAGSTAEQILILSGQSALVSGTDVDILNTLLTNNNLDIV